MVEGQIDWRLGAAFFLSLSVASASSLDSGWSFHVWQSDDGLPNNSITSLAQTPDGYLWVANPTRLARFDGVDFEEFANNSFAPPYARKISTLLRSHDGGLWMAMDHGPVMYLKSGIVQVFNHGLPDLDAQVFAEDNEGAIWVDYHGIHEIVCRIKDGKVTRFAMPDGSPRWFDCPPVSDNQGRIWFAQNGGIGMFRQGLFQPLVKIEGSDRILQLARASSGGVWALVGLQLFKCDDTGHLRKFGSLPVSRPDIEPAVLLEDSTGAVWIGTANSGLFRYNGTGFETIPTSYSRISTLLEDQEGNIWAGTGGGGLDCLQPRMAELESTETGLPSEPVQSICEDSQGVLWATTSRGQLINRVGNKWNMVSVASQWPGGRASCVTVDGTGAVWIGTRTNCLYRLQNGVFQSWVTQDGLVSHVIHALLAGTNGDMWIGGSSPDSLQCLRQRHLITLKIPANVSFIRAMAEDASGNIWIGTSKGILLRVQDNQVIDETARVLGTPRSIRCFYATPDGSLWIGHAGGGVGRLKNGKYAEITSRQGLFDDYISQIVDDGRGWLWFGSDHGIFKVRQQELDDLAEGRINRVQSIHYGRSEDLPSLQAVFGVSPDTMRSRDGRLWFPTSSALVAVDPTKLHEDMLPPAVILKQIIVDDQVVAAYPPTVQSAGKQQVLQLAPGYHQVEFAFTAPSFSAPENVHFQYRLKGFDDEWKDAGVQRNVSYSRLDPGKYQFQVKACNSDDVWNDKGVKVSVTVKPFIWQTLVFRLAALTLVMALVVILVRYISFRRLRFKLQALEQQAALDKERARIARDIHDDLGGNLTQIKLLLELILQDHTQSDKIKGRAQQGIVKAREAIESLDETVWTVNPRNDTLQDMIDYIGQFAVEFLRPVGIRCRVDLPPHPPDCIVSAQVRHNLFLAVKEALNNVVRHAHAGEVWLRIVLKKRVIEVVIEDNGHGIANGTPRAGSDGLRNMHQRMEEVGGQFQMESMKDSGTRISFIFPYAPKE